jgi:hypothetical protein
MPASTTVLDKPVADPATPAVADHAEFLTHMNAMAAHYTTKSKSPVAMYALPVHLVHPVSDTPAPAKASAGAVAVDAALKAGKTQTTSFATNQRDAVNAATNLLQQNHDTSAFAKQMQALENQAQQQAHDNIHQQFQNLIQIGTAHPEQQQRILSLTNQIGAFFTNLISSVGAFFQKVAKEIMGWINSAVDWIKGAAATVANWVSGAVSSIGNFFSGLF